MEARHHRSSDVLRSPHHPGGGAVGSARPRLTPHVQVASWFVTFLVLGLLAAYLNRHHLEQQSNFDIYVAVAERLAAAALDGLTYPTWGYPFVLLLIGRPDLIAIPQVLVATVAMTALFIRLRDELPDHRRAVALLFVLAVPWYLLHSVKWPLSFAASSSVLGTLVLGRALRTGGTSLGVVAGGLFGVGLYFRSEYLYLPLFFVLVGVLSRFTMRLPTLPMRPLLGCAATAWALLMPWGLYYHQQTGEFSLTASQRGIVAFISLGQLPRNPWNAVYEDEYAYAYLNETAPQLQVNSHLADRLLFDEFTRRVKAEPAAFGAKMAWNAAVSLITGFYGGEVPMSEEQWSQFRAVKRRPWAGMLPGATGGDTAVDPRTRVALLYWLLSKIAGSIIVLLAAVGMVRAFWRGCQSPLLLLFASTIIYQWLLFMALATEPRYKNGLYLYMVPFAILAWRDLVAWGRRDLSSAERQHPT